MATESAAICQHLLATGIVHSARKMAVYIHCEKLREVNTTAIVVEALRNDRQKNGARIYVPRVLDKDANMHFLHITSLDELEVVPPYGIREPRVQYEDDGTPREDVADVDAPIDLIVMPGLGFDSQGRRLGRGGGYYDKFISFCAEKAARKGWTPPLLAGLAFQTQIVSDVPCDAHDQPVDVLVTAEGVMYCSERGKELEN